MSVKSIAALLVRVGLVLLFLLFSALDKILGFQHAIGQAHAVFKPHALAVRVLICGLGIEIFCSLGVVTGIADRACAFILAGYCAATAVLYKRFWPRATSRPTPTARADTCSGISSRTCRWLRGS